MLIKVSFPTVLILRSLPLRTCSLYCLLLIGAPDLAIATPYLYCDISRVERDFVLCDIDRFFQHDCFPFNVSSCIYALRERFRMMVPNSFSAIDLMSMLNIHTT